jgi:hypothetical protein
MKNPEYVMLKDRESDTSTNIVKYDKVISQLHLTFSHDSRFGIISLSNGMGYIFRTKDGTHVTNLNRNRFRMVESSMSGSYRTVLGIVDFLTHRTHNLNIKDLISINEGKITIFKDDLSLAEKRTDEFSILGQPLPGLYPYMLKKAQEMTRETMGKVLPLLRDYVTVPNYSNMIHYLASQNLPEHLYNELRHPDLSYLNAVSQPI